MRKFLGGFAVAMALIALTGAAFGTAFRSMTIVSDANISTITCATANTNGELCVEKDIETNQNLDVAGTATLTGATSTGALTASSLTASGASSFTTGLSSPIVGTSLMTIRFCGNGPDGATTTYVGPVLEGQIATDFQFSSAGCDAADSTTEATADAVWSPGFAFKPVAMSCVGLCTGGTPANDAIVFQLRDDTASVTGMTCTTAALGGDAVPAQCSVRTNSPATVAAASAIAVSITMTNDDCNEAGDDFECLVFATF